MGIWLCALLSVTLIEAFAHGQCFPKASQTWTSEGGNLVLNGRVFHMKGTAWFGLETPDVAPHGLWGDALTVESAVHFLQRHNFNALRLPFSVENVLTNPLAKAVDCHSNPDNICKMRMLELMEYVVDAMGAAGIVVMLDQHRIDSRTDNTFLPPLWFTERFPEARVLESWDVLLRRLGHKWNVFALDLKNEPNGIASWGKGRSTDWNKAAERIINHISRNHPQYKGLFFVEGVGDESVSSHPQRQVAHFWGGNLEGVYSHPIDTGDAALNRRVVYSPHVYGPSVWNQDYFADSNFPRNMPSIWNDHFGYVRERTGRAVVVGEWGGRYTGADRVWQDAISQYFVDNCLSSTFYWCLNPNSGDTGGLLKDDWRTEETAKLTLLARTQPNPTKLNARSTDVCVSGAGEFPNRACSAGGVVTTAPPAPPTIPNPGYGAVTFNPINVDEWQSNGVPTRNYNLEIKNRGSVAMCGGSIIRIDGGSIVEIWNVNKIRDREYSTANWLRINSGQTVANEVGFIMAGNVLPTVQLIRLNSSC